MASGFRSVLFLIGISRPPAALYGLPVADPVVQLLIGDNDGNVLAEYRPLVESVTWELSAAGACSFVLPTSVVLAAAAGLSPGNRILINFDNGLPAWAGLITGAREFKPNGSAVFKAAGLMEIFKWRMTAVEKVYNHIVGEIIEDLVEAVSGITAGNIAVGSGEVSVTYHSVKMSDVIKQLLPVEDFAMEITGVLSSGVIGGVVNVYQRGSVTIENALLVEGHNLGDASYRSEDVIVNKLRVIGAGTGWTSSTRTMTEVSDVASITQYGLREETLFAEEIDSVAALQTLGNSVLARMGTMRQAVMGTASDRTPGTFEQYGVGNMIRVILPDKDVDGYFELLGREYRPQANACSVVLEA